MSPEKKKGGGGVITPAHRPNDQKAAEDMAHSNRIRRARHVPGQIPVVLGADVHEPRPGRKTADLIPDEQCPRCGFARVHRGEWPPTGVASKRCPTCRLSSEFALTPVPAGQAKRGRRAA